MKRGDAVWKKYIIEELNSNTNKNYDFSVEMKIDTLTEDSRHNPR